MESFNPLWDIWHNYVSSASFKCIVPYHPLLLSFMPTLDDRCWIRRLHMLDHRGVNFRLPRCRWGPCLPSHMLLHQMLYCRNAISLMHLIGMDVKSFSYFQRLCLGPLIFSNIFANNVVTPDAFVAKLSRCDLKFDPLTSGALVASV